MLPNEFREMMEHLEALRGVYPGHATRGALRAMGKKIFILEVLKLTNFGGAHVLAWHLLRLANSGYSWLRLTSYLEQLWQERSCSNGC